LKKDKEVESTTASSNRSIGSAVASTDNFKKNTTILRSASFQSHSEDGKRN
jgi:hypothetical protein